MAKITIRYATVFLLLALTAIVVNDLHGDYSQMKDSGLEAIDNIPMQLDNGWQGKDFPLEEMVYDILETRAIVHRSFNDRNGNNVFLSIVHYADTKVDFHAPESCIGGRGLQTIKTSKTITLHVDGVEKSINVAQMITTRSNGKSLSYYFYKSGDFIGSNYIKMRLSIAANKLLNNDTRGSLIRISTTLLPEKEKESETLLVHFLQDLFPYVNQAL
jgi:EpsI family protein